MKTLDLTQSEITMDELLQWARAETVLILARDGHTFILEDAADFEREVAELGNSAKFMHFLEDRALEEASISLEEIESST